MVYARTVSSIIVFHDGTYINLEKRDYLKQKISIKGIIFIQLAVIVYTFSGVMGKLAAGHDFLSWPFIIFIGLELFILGCYAIIWQQIIKRYPLSIAYVNRAMAIFWSTLWAAIIFGERITLNNIIGVIVIFVGIMVVNSDEY